MSSIGTNISSISTSSVGANAKALLGRCGAALENTARTAGVALRILKQPEAHLQSAANSLEKLTRCFEKTYQTESKDTNQDNPFLENIDPCISELEACEKKLPEGSQKKTITEALTHLKFAKTKLKDPSNLTDLHACFNALRPAKEIIFAQLNLSSSKDTDEVLSAGLLATSKLDYQNLTADKLETFRKSVAINPINTSPLQETKEKVQKTLFAACEKGDVTEFGILVNNLLRSGDKSNLQAKNTDGDTLLHVAAKMGNAAITNMLIGAGADLNAEGQYSNTPSRALEHEMNARERNVEPEKLQSDPLYQNLLKTWNILNPDALDALSNKKKPPPKGIDPNNY